MFDGTRKPWRKTKKSGSLAVIIPKHAAQTVTAGNPALSFANFDAGLDQTIVGPLMISLRVIVRQKLTHSVSQRPFSKENQAFQAFLF